MSNQAEIAGIPLIQSFSRRWSDVLVEVTSYSCEGYVLQRLPHENKLRLSVLLEEAGKIPCEPRVQPNVPSATKIKPRDMSFIPEGMDLYGYSPDTSFAKVGHVVFEASNLQELLGAQNLSLANTPRIGFADDQIWTLAKLLCDAIQNPDPSAQLYGDSLITAISARLTDQTSANGKAAAGLSKLQLQNAISFLDAHLPNRVDLATMANLAGLSQSHYCRAFKASTGMAPYQWQLNKRIERAKCLLLTTSYSLGEIAEATGFADGVHFGRTFRNLTGVTPALWRADRLT